MNSFNVGQYVVKKRYGDGTIYIIEKLMHGNWDMMLLKSTNPDHTNTVLVRQCQFRGATPKEIAQGYRDDN